MNIKFLYFDQPIGRIHLTNIDGKTLDRLCKADIRRIDNKEKYIGIERDLDQSRLKEISSFIDTSYATFPNNVVLNLQSKKINIDYNTCTLTILHDQEDIFEILDGQHRIHAFSKSKKNFMIPIAFFVDLNNSNKAIVFNNINFEQKPVSSSMSYELEEMFPVYTPEKMIRNIVEKLNKHKKSPYFKKIKMRGVSDALNEKGVISLNSFMSEMIKKTYFKSKKHILREYLISSNKIQFSFNDKEYTEKFHNINHFLWDYYFYGEENSLFEILMNFFKAVKSTFKVDWNPKGLLMKTVGFIALFNIFEELYYDGSIKKNLSEEFFFSKLKPVKILDGQINSKNFGSSISEARKIEKMLSEKL